MYLKVAPLGISVIICTHNGFKRIMPTLDALRLQNVPNELLWEILLIDNGSTDDTLKIVDDFRNKFKESVPLRIIHEPVLGKSNALIKGYDEAKYELMLVCDDDNWLQPEYLKTVAEIFIENPEIGLLGGYGIADFRGEEEPCYFKKWEQCFACGNHHGETGFLASGNFSIWGAGSVLRKSIWLSLRDNGFYFTSATGQLKGIEDIELAHAVRYSGNGLYFDERLWFYHDLSGGRITLENIKKQVRLSFRNSTLLVAYSMAYQNSPARKKRFGLTYIRMIIALSNNLAHQVLKRNNQFLRLYIFLQLIELTTHRKKYKLIYNDIFSWISQVKGKQPLKGMNL